MLNIYTAEAIKAYLISAIDADLQAASPIIALYDLMDEDDASKIHVECQRTTMPPKVANGAVDVIIGIKSRWQQSDVAANLAEHKERFLAVLMAIQADGLEALIEAETTEIGIACASMDRQITDKVLKGWYYSQIEFQVQVWLKA